MKKNDVFLIRNIFKSVTGKYSVYFVQMFSVMLYARVFEPETFGIIAGVQVLVTFFMMFAEMGIGPALIAQKNISSRERDGIYTVTFILGLLISVIFLLTGDILNTFYSREEYTDIVPFISITIVLSLLNVVPRSSLVKDVKFIEISKNEILSEVLAIPFVFLLLKFVDSHVALIFRFTAMSSFRLILNLISSKKTEQGCPSFGLYLSAIKPLVRFSSYQLLFNFVNYFTRNLDNILVGKFLGMTVLGVYEKSYVLMSYPLQLLTFSVSPAIQPTLTQYRDDVVKIRESTEFLVKLLSVLGAGVGSLMYLQSEAIVLLLFGNAWIEVTPVIQILALSVPAQVIYCACGGVFQAMHRTDLLFKSALCQMILTVPLIILGVINGSLINLAWLMVIAHSVSLVIYFYNLYVIALSSSMLKFFKNMITGVFLFFALLGMGLWLIEFVAEYNKWIVFSINTILYLIITTIVAYMTVSGRFFNKNRK